MIGIIVAYFVIRQLEDQIVVPQVSRAPLSEKPATVVVRDR